MKCIASVMLWPTAAQFFAASNHEKHDTELVRIMLDRKIPESHTEELRVPGLEKLNNISVDWLIVNVKSAVHCYLGSRVDMDVTVRGVVLRKGSHLSTHMERDESDLAVAYWPSGGYPTSHPINSMADGFLAPTFCIEDPSRGLCDPRLPHESPHGFYVAPRPGLMAVFPAHVPHNMHPYMGEKPFIHLVFQIKLKQSEAPLYSLNC